ncbi:MAG TPA: MarR family transcriptional regulator [Pseudolabrys sp.]
MQNTRKKDQLHHALLDLVSVLTRPQPDERILHEAGVSLDRALFPLLVRIGLYGPVGVVELADIVGRDHSTVSRQLAKLESLGLINRAANLNNQRVKEAVLTEAGEQMREAIGAARHRVFDDVQRHWSAADRAELLRLVRKLADDMAERLVQEDQAPGRSAVAHQ